jgi:hypothetical protein
VRLEACSDLTRIAVRMLRNKCTDVPELLSGCHRNECSYKTGITVWMRPELVSGSGRNTQLYWIWLLGPIREKKRGSMLPDYIDSFKKGMWHWEIVITHHIF